LRLLLLPFGSGLCQAGPLSLTDNHRDSGNCSRQYQHSIQPDLFDLHRFPRLERFFSCLLLTPFTPIEEAILGRTPS
jgi:hypothetical protein